jgi:alpha-1,3-rhamnosyl/mannosyltransferase
MPLTIGIDARAAAEVPAGRGRLVRELLGELSLRGERHRYRLYARTAWETPDERFEWALTRYGDPWWNLATARRASRECDVFLSSNSYLTAWLLTVPSVVIVYDLVAFDATMRPSRRSALIERLTLGLATRRATSFVAISQATASALAARYPRCAKRTRVALLGNARALQNGVGNDGADRRDLPDAGFVLAVGTLEPRKNLPLLVEAYRMLPQTLQDRHPLAVVGALGWQTGDTLRALHSLGSRAKLLGYVPDGVLAELYHRCALFCYPSLGEGFGLPVLEAMSAGAAVVTSNVSSLPEVGGEAVEYADPHDARSVSAAMRRVLEDEQLRRVLGERARRRAAEFSWASFAAAVLDELERAAARRYAARP